MQRIPPAKSGLIMCIVMMIIREKIGRKRWREAAEGNGKGEQRVM